MKMRKNTLLKKIEQGYRENYCNGEYTLNLVTENNDIKGHIYIDTDSVKVAPLPEQQTSEESITDTIIADDNIEVLRAKQDLNAKYSNSYRKHLHAIINPEWHHVSLATLANIDNDMLDEKRRHYMKVYRMTANVINSIYKCNKLTSIDKLRTNLIQTVRTMAKMRKSSGHLFNM